MGSSIQVLAHADWDIPAFVAGCAARGVEWKWFGAAAPAGFTSAHRHWGYVDAQALPATDAILARLLDLRVPLTFDLDDCAAIGRIVAEEAITYLVSA